jgi:hypothetical protein
MKSLFVQFRIPPQGPQDKGREYENYIPSLEGGLYRGEGGRFEGSKKNK